MAGRETRRLWQVLATVAVLVAVAAIVRALFPDPPAGELASSARAVRPWAAAAYDALEKPAVSSGRGGELRYQAEVVDVQYVAEPTDASKGRLNLQVTAAEEEWVPRYEMVSLNEANGFRFVDGARSLGVRWLALGVAGESGGAGKREAALFSPAMEPIGGETLDRLGVKPHLTRMRVGVGGMPVTELRADFDVAGMGDFRLEVRGVFDRRTKVALSRATGWSGFGDAKVLNAELRCLHDVEPRLVVDLCAGPVVSRTVFPVEGEVVRDGDFSLEVVKVTSGETTSRSWEHGGGTRGRHFDFKGVGGGSTVVVFAVTPRAIHDAISFRATSKAGQPLAVAESGKAAELVAVEIDVAGEELAEIELIYRPNFTRVMIDLPALGGVPVANEGLDDLFDSVLPSGEVSSIYQLRELVEGVAQLEDRTRWGGGGPVTGVFPLDLSGKTLRQVVGEFQAGRPDVKVRVHPVDFTVEMDDPAAAAWWQRALRRVGDWL